ncbi:penicillin-binding protein [Gracilibacillus dipsosauri]|uniref:penicillin-binding protein n=1 Tax=Gracilibacillus dipsosauri TaxID=178340 RepID=UPI0024090535
MKKKSTEIMPLLWICLFSIAFLIIVGRFVYIQATGEVNGVDIKKLAAEKRTNEYTIPAKRGTIYDRKGMALAQEHIVYRLYAVLDEKYTTNEDEPRHVIDIQTTAAKLAPHLDLEASEIAKILKNGKEDDRFQVEFGSNSRELNQEQKDDIAALDLPGIYFMEEPIRFYPNGTFASHTIGLTDKQDNNIIGISGVEGSMDEYLTGESGSISYQRDKFNVKLLNPNEIINKADDGDNVYLTLDQKIQTLLEDSLTEVVKEYNPERVTAIVMDPKTGEVLAMGNRPSFNPNNLGDVQNWYNDAIANPFEPGSTMKIFTLASAIEEGVWNPDEKFKSGKYKGGENITAIRDHNWTGWGNISYLEGIQRSSNVAAAKLAYEKIGSEKFLHYLKAFGFGEKTGIDLPGEVSGSILYNYPIEQITTAFGQGTTTTPIQLMQAATAVANNGKMLKPYIIKEIKDAESGETISKGVSEVVGQPISSETAKKTLKILETVVTSKVGTGYNRYNLDGYSVAGKTGTAQIPDPETGRYLTGRENYVFSFLGMAPADNPELMMYVSVKQPELEDDEPDSAPSSFIFRNVMENSLRYLNIDADKEKTDPVNVIEVPEWKNKSTSELTESLDSLGATYEVIGDGNKIMDVSVNAGEQITPIQKIFIVTDQPKIPDLTGWSRREVLVLRDMLGFNLDWSGEGYVVKQSIAKGKPITSQDTLTIELSEPKKESSNKEEES